LSTAVRFVDPSGRWQGGPRGSWTRDRGNRIRADVPRM